MTKLDLALARLKKLPPDRQEAVAVQIDWLLDDEERGESALSDEQWAEISARMADSGEDFIPHAEVVDYFEKKYGR